ncbi:MAG: M28 family metallopeptidase [Luteibaculum sp.]
MHRILVYCFAALFICQTAWGQKEIARNYIDTLCSPYFFGRGYAKDGVNKAAEYLQNELKLKGIDPFFGYSYFQPFDHKANVFTGNTKLSIGGKQLELGKDFIPNAMSGSFDGEIPIYPISIPQKLEESFVKDLLATKPEGKFALAINKEELDQSENGELYKMILSQGYPLLIYGYEKLTWGASTRSTTYPILEIAAKKLKTKKPASIRVNNQLLDYRSKNVAGFIRGTKNPDRYVILSAHYDHLGGMDENVFVPGANDNASGTAMVLNLAGILKENPPEYSVIPMFFAGEELGLLGSKFFTDKEVIPLNQIAFVLNLDLLGTGDDGFTIVNGSIFEDYTKVLQSLNDSLEKPLPQIKLRGEAANSDHYWFSKKGVPAFFIYTLGGITAYHDIQDKAATLPLTRYDDMLILLENFIRNIP